MPKENNILLVDNDPTNRYNLKLALWQLDCTVHECEKKFEVITFIVTQKPNIVFVSLELAKADDFDLLHKIKELHDCTVIVHAEEICKDDVMRCINASVDEVLLKPCTQLERLKKIVSSS